MSKPLVDSAPDFTDITRAKSPRSRRWLRFARWLILGLVVLLLVTYVDTAVYGVQDVRQAIHAEALSDYQSLKARSPGAVYQGFGGPEFEVCRAVFPGLIYCRYQVSYGMEAGGSYESLYFWSGSNCQRLRHVMLTVY